MKKRIWELDALRGLALLGMIGIHLIYDLVDLFGVWHWLGRLNSRLLLGLGIVLALAGLYVETLYFDVSGWLIPLGLCPEWFESSDYFPLLPNLGFFLVGAWIGRQVYKDKQTRFPGVNEKYYRPLCALGRSSLWVYLLHQPVLAGIAMLIAAL